MIDFTGFEAGAIATERENHSGGQMLVARNSRRIAGQKEP
jgi:hypothetical protein